MTENRSKEYDAFGPWILVIDEEHTLPPLFSGYKRLQDRAVMMFKVPRRIERRKASPNMHLYDAVVGLFDTHLLLLSRHGNSVHERRVELRDIQAIKNYQCLLLGELYIYTDTNIVKIRYNTVSEKIIAGFIGKIHELQNNPVRDLKIKPMEYNVNNIDYLYLNLLRILEKEDSSIRLVAYQPNANLESKPGISGRISQVFSGAPSLQCTAFVSNSKELIIISRSDVIKSRKQTDYAYAYTYIPLSKIAHAGLASGTHDPTLYQLTLSTGAHKFKTLFKQSNTRVRALYSALK